MFSKLLFLAPMPPPLSVPIVFPHLCFSDNGHLEFTPFFPSTSLFFLVPLFIIPFIPPVDSHFGYRFNFYLHTCGSLHLGLANSLLVLSLSRS